MPDLDTSLDDRRLLNQIADRHRHDLEAEDLRQHHDELRQGAAPCTTTRQ